VVGDGQSDGEQQRHAVRALRDWACAALGEDAGTAAVAPLAGDASFRRYYRLRCRDRDVVLCHAPPESEKNREFVTIARAFAAAGVRVPAVLAVDYDRGWLCLEDLGDALLLPRLDDESVDGYYGEALAMLRRLAQLGESELALPAYDRQRLQEELDLCPQWFFRELLGLSWGEREQARFARLSTVLCERALAQAQLVVHRDFHARNLMCLDDGELATIDFQDAVRGPVTYDAVSLLRDCYRRWPAERVRAWALAHRDRLRKEGVRVPEDDEQYLQDFDYMGLQRHIKVLGIFSRLWLRDGKRAYLEDLPRVMVYVTEVLASHGNDPALADFAAWFDDQVLPRAAPQAWYGEP
jgi:aminoglycoside/choline kinase family phosphotransferase